ncbi:MAG: DUF58 domain-containing protein [Saprospiraceae bacterium]|nr:DUF58 domain-containing protein [Saprospiraceae bacterium]
MSFIKSLYLTKRFFIALLGIICLFILSFSFNFLEGLTVGICGLWIGVVIYEIVNLYRLKNGLNGERHLAQRLSNGDQNEIRIAIHNKYPFKVDLEIIDEIPYQFQRRDNSWKMEVDAEDDVSFNYNLRPVKRGEYEFGFINVFASYFTSMIQRRYRLGEQVSVPVYPSYLMMQKYEFAAFSHQLIEFGIKRVRKLGHTMEFEQIKEYVRGDDPRTINWKATGRSNALMVNTYQDERSQPIYCIIDKGRMMRFPFDGLSLLDYSINASLVLSNIAMKKQDKAGLITFSNKMSSVVVADRKPRHIQKILDALYNQKTLYKESNFEMLSAFVNTRIKQRSLMLLFTNFESYSSFQRQLPYFVSMARRHLVIIVFFRNRELAEMIGRNPKNTQEVYTQVVAQQYESEKYLITKKLQGYGIHTILTYPEDLTVDTINKYLELKARGTI